MATRRRNTKAISGEYSWLLHSGDTAEQGKAAGLDTATGDVRPMGSSATQIFVGFFAETLVGDGTLKVRVSVPNEVQAEWLKNDTAPNDVAITDIGSECYAKDSQTVSMLDTSRSKAGRVLDYDAASDLVLVQGGAAVTGPTGASGIEGSVATIAALKAVAAASRVDGAVVVVRADRAEWIFVAASTQTVDGANQLVVAPDAGTGRWVRVGKSIVLKLPIDYTLADAAALLTVPEQMALRLVGMPFWEITTGFTGGTASAIGVSSDSIATTKGDLLGGAAGQLTAVIGTAGVKPGTIGPLIDTPAEVQAFVLIAGKIIRFDRIASVYTAGVGFVHIPVAIAQVA